MWPTLSLLSLMANWKEKQNDKTNIFSNNRSNKLQLLNAHFITLKSIISEKGDHRENNSFLSLAGWMCIIKRSSVSINKIFNH